jgi:hypothetical protein
LFRIQDTELRSRNCPRAHKNLLHMIQREPVEVMFAHLKVKDAQVMGLIETKNPSDAEGKGKTNLTELVANEILRK